MKLTSARRVAILAGTLILMAVVVLTAGCASTPPEQTYPILGTVVVSADLVRGSDAPLGAVCAITSQFARGEEIVPRVKVLDPKTNKYLTDKDLKSVKFYLKDGTSVALQYGAHPAPPKPVEDSFWAGGWKVPDNYPTGTTGWWVEAVTNDGRTGKFQPPTVSISALTILERKAASN